MMRTYRLPVDAWLRPDRPERRDLSRFRGPRTIAEVLAEAAAVMEAEDQAAGDMNASWLRPPGPVRPSLLRRLLGRH